MKRADGVLLRHTDPMYRIAAQVMATRSDSMNMITLDIPLAPIDAYLRQKKREGHTMSHMAVIMAAYQRMIAEYTGMMSALAVVSECGEGSSSTGDTRIYSTGSWD